MTAVKKNMPAPGVKRPLIWAIKGLPGAEGAPTARRGAPWSWIPSEADTSMPDLAMFVWAAAQTRATDAHGWRAHARLPWATSMRHCRLRQRRDLPAVQGGLT
jgi:hypothetical protein